MAAACGGNADPLAVLPEAQAPAATRLDAQAFPRTFDEPGVFPLSVVRAEDQDGRATGESLVWRLLADAPWIAGHPVARPPAPGDSLAHFVGYGTTWLEVATQDGRLRDTLEVRVEAPVPTVVAVAGESVGVLRVHAYRADQADWTGVRVGGTAPTGIEIIDSATVALRFAAPTTGCVGAAVQPVSLLSVDGPKDLSARFPREGERRLAVGDTVRLPAAEAHCLMLAPDGDAEYVVSFLDLRALSVYGDAAMPYNPDFWERLGSARGSWHMDVSSRPGWLSPAEASLQGSPAVAPSAVSTPGASPDWEQVTRPQRSAASGAEGALPEVGDTVMARGRLCTSGGERNCATRGTGDVPGQVIRVYGGYVALVVPLGQSSQVWSASHQADLDAWYAAVPPDAMAAHFEGLFGVPRPSSQGTAALFVLAGEGLSGGFATGDASTCAIQLPSGGPSDLLAHEMAHCFQLRLGNAPLRTAWGMEGGADVAAWDFRRSWVGQSLRTETGQRAFGDLGQGSGVFPNPFVAIDGDEGGSMASLALWSHGYGSAAALIMDWIARMVNEAGVSETTAVRTVLLGLMEQGYGCGEEMGLVTRVGRHWNGPFDPVEEGLLSVLRYATDGRLGGRFEMTWLDVDPEYFLPLRDLAASIDGSRHQERHLSTRHSTYGLMEISDPGVGAAIFLEDEGALYEWLVVRVR